MTAFTLSFTANTYILKRKVKNVGSYFLIDLNDNHILKEYSTYTAALNAYRRNPNTGILPKADAIKHLSSTIK